MARSGSYAPWRSARHFRGSLVVEISFLPCCICLDEQQARPLAHASADVVACTSCTLLSASIWCSTMWSWYTRSRS